MIVLGMLSKKKKRNISLFVFIFSSILYVLPKISFAISQISLVFEQLNWILILLVYVMYTGLFHYADKILVKIVLFIVVLILVNPNFINGVLGFGAITVLVTLLLRLLFLGSVELNGGDIKRFSYVFALLLVFYDLFVPKYGFNTNNIGGTYCTFFILGSIWVNIRNLKHVVIFVLMAILASKGIIESDTRTSFGVVFLYFVIRLLPSCFLKNKFVFWFTFICMTIGAIVYALFYVDLYLHGEVLDIFGNSNKKFFSGREQIWLELLTRFAEQPLVGIGSHINLISFDSMQTHNNMLNHLVVYGLPIFLLIILMLVNVFKKIRLLLDDHISYSSFCALIAVFFGGYNENNALIFPTFILLAFVYSRKNRFNLIYRVNDYT